VVLDMMGAIRGPGEVPPGIALAPDYSPLRSNFGLSLAISGAAAGGDRRSSRRWWPTPAADGRVRQNLLSPIAMNGDLESSPADHLQDLTKRAPAAASYFMASSKPCRLKHARRIAAQSKFLPQSSGGALDEETRHAANTGTACVQHLAAVSSDWRWRRRRTRKRRVAKVDMPRRRRRSRIS